MDQVCLCLCERKRERKRCVRRNKQNRQFQLETKSSRIRGSISSNREKIIRKHTWGELLSMPVKERIQEQM